MLHAGKHCFQRGHIGFKVWPLLIEEHVLGGDHDLRSPFARIDARALHDVLQWERATDFRRRSTELATATTAARYFDDPERGTVANDWDLLHGRLHLLGN